MKSNNISYEIDTIIIIIGILTFSYFRLYLFANVLYVLLLTLLLLVKSDFLIFIFVAFLPTNGFLPAEYKFFGIFHIQQTTHLFAFLRTLQIFSAYRINRKDILKKNPALKIIGSLILFVFAYYIIREIKYLIIMPDAEIIKLPTRLIKYSILFLTLYFLTFLVTSNKYKIIIKKGFLFSIAIIGLSIIFTSQLEKIGLVVVTLDENFIREGFHFQRKAGFFLDFGSGISAGSFLSISTAYLLTEWRDKFNATRIYVIFLISIAAIACLFTISRAPILSLALVFIIYFIFPLKMRKIPLFLLLIFLSFSLIGSNLFEIILFRLSRSDQAFQTDELLTRGGTWLFFFNFFLKNPYLIIFGTFENPFAHLINVLRSAHNFFIQLYFFGGLILYYFFYKIVRKLLIYKNFFNIQYSLIFIPVLAELMGVSELAIIFPLSIILMVSLKPCVINK
jgi:hypothetical protein